MTRYTPNLTHPLFQPMPFDAWLANNPDLTDVDGKCPYCAGFGRIECGGHTHYCDECDGTGRALLSLREQYERQKRADLRILRALTHARPSGADQ
jgi:hypothetical protein